MGLILVCAAVVCEVLATLSLRAGVEQPSWYIASVLGYAAAYALLGYALRFGISVGSAYAVWAALGVVLTAMLGIMIFREELNPVQLGGAMLIIGGVVLVVMGEPKSRDGGRRHMTAANDEGRRA